MRLKNEALLALEGSHVIIGFHKDAKWVGGKLTPFRSFNNDDDSPDVERPMLWKLEQFLPPRVRGYERPVEVFFTTPDMAWWAPATPRQSDKDMEEKRERWAEEMAAHAEKAHKR
jgi:hypothetical protein